MGIKLPNWCTVPPKVSTYRLDGLCPGAKLNARLLQGGDVKSDLEDELCDQDLPCTDSVKLTSRCLRIGADPSNDIIVPTMAPLALAVAYRSNGKLYLYGCVPEVEVDGDAWETEKWAPVPVPSEVSICGEPIFSFSGTGGMNSLRELLRIGSSGIHSDKEEEELVLKNTEINSGIKRSRSHPLMDRDESGSPVKKKIRHQVSVSTIQEDI